MAGTIDDLWTEVNGVQLPHEVAADWGYASPVPEEDIAPDIAPVGGPPITDWNQTIADPNSNPKDLISPPPEPAMPTPAELQAQLPTAPGTSGSLRVSQSRPTGRPDLVQAPPEATDPNALMGPHAEAASIRTQGILRQAEGEAGMLANEAEMYDTEAQFKNELATDLAVKNAFLTKHRAEREARTAAELAKVQSVDPARRWKQASTFQKAMGLAGAFLGGFMEPVTGKNTALATIMQIIDNDIRAQQTDIETQRESVYRMERRGERENAAEESDIERFEKGRLMRLDAMKTQLVKEQAQYKSQITRGKYQEMIGLVADQAAETWDKLNQIWDAHGLQRYNSYYAARRGEQQARNEAYGISVQRQNAKDRLQFDKDQAKGKAGELSYIRNPDGSGVLLYDSKVAGADQLVKNVWDEKTGLPGYAKLTADLKKLVQMQDKLGHPFGGPGTKAFERFFTGDDFRAAKQQYELIASNIRHNLYGAALTENEAEKFIAMMPEPSTWTKADSTNRYRDILKSKATEAQTNFVNPLNLSRPEDGKRLDLIKDWGTVESAPKQVRDAGTTTEQIAAVRYTLGTRPDLISSDTTKDVIKNIEASTKEIARGQLSPSSITNEIITQGERLAADLEGAGRKVDAVQVRSAIHEYMKELNKPTFQKKALKQYEDRQRTVEPPSVTYPEQDKVTVPELQRYEP